MHQIALAKPVHAPIVERFSPNKDDWYRLRLVSRMRDVSPLRYPGGKRKLAVLIAQIFTTTQRPIKLLVEPFAGGAAVSIALLEADFVESIAIADADEMVAAFWKTVFSEKAEAFARMVESAPVTMKERRRVIASRPRSDLSLAYKCLFMNRTSFSGIIKETAGVIGGKNQTGSHGLGCRFNKKRLAMRIRALSKMRDRVCFVRHQDYTKTIADIRAMFPTPEEQEGIFWYCDPPFFEKAQRLYRYTFDAAEHRRLKKSLATLPGAFVLSYDDVPAAEELYGNDPRSMCVPMQYNAAINECRSAEELIVSDLVTSPGLKISVYAKTRFVLNAPYRRKCRK